MRRRYLFSIILFAAVLLTSIFLVNATYISVDPSHPGPDEIPPVEDYDPFADVSGEVLGYPDGKINIRDIAYTAIKFGTSGNSVRNVTLLNWQGGSCLPPGVYKDVVEISILGWTCVLHTNGMDRGAFVDSDQNHILLPFIFSPEGQLVNITDLWIVFTETTSVAGSSPYFSISLNNNWTTTLGGWKHTTTWDPVLRTFHIEDLEAYQVIYEGLNTLEIRDIQGFADARLWFFRITAFIEYEYEI